LRRHPVADRSKIINEAAFRWEGIPLRDYRDGEAVAGVTRQVLLGAGDDGGALGFVVRYFEVAPGATTMLERHAHVHAVMVLRGRGEVLLEGERTPLAPHDVVYVAPQAEHQFRAADDELLGFLCVRPRREEGRQ
jgi:quercetin dioxygenase-like cupin family protein